MDRTKKAETAGYHSSLRFLSENAPFKGESPHFTEATGVARTSSTFRKTVNTKMGTTSFPENVRPTFDGKPEADVNLIGENSLDEDSNRFSYLAG